MNDTDVYPVGVLSKILIIWSIFTEGDYGEGKFKLSWRHIKQEWQFIRYQISMRDWNAVVNSFNGYLAEHHGHPHDCGHGWTKKRAIRRANRICEGRV